MTALDDHDVYMYTHYYYSEGLDILMLIKSYNYIFIGYTIYRLKIYVYRLPCTLLVWAKSALQTLSETSPSWTLFSRVISPVQVLG